MPALPADRRRGDTAAVPAASGDKGLPLSASDGGILNQPLPGSLLLKATVSSERSLNVNVENLAILFTLLMWFSGRY